MRGYRGPSKDRNTNILQQTNKFWAVVWALQKLNTYFYEAKQIQLRTDHEELTFLERCRFYNDRSWRWNLAIQDYNIVPEYISGKKKVEDFSIRQIDGKEIKRNDVLNILRPISSLHSFSLQYS